MQLIPNFATNYPRFWSVQLGSIAAILSAVELVLPQFQTVLPEPWGKVLTLVFMIAALIARGIKQPNLAPATTDTGSVS